MDMHQLVNIFCEIDDFCNELEKHCQHYMLSGVAHAPSLNHKCDDAFGGGSGRLYY